MLDNYLQQTTSAGAFFLGALRVKVVERLAVQLPPYLFKLHLLFIV